MPVRNHNDGSAVDDEATRILRIAALVSAAEQAKDLTVQKRIEGFTERAARLFIKEFESGDRAALLKDLKDELRLWGSELYGDPQEILRIVENNPAVLTFPLGGMLGVAPNNKKMFGFLADAIDSIVIHSVLKKPLEKLKGYLKQPTQKTSSTRSKTGSKEHPIAIMDVMSEDLPVNELKLYTYNYLYTAIRQWLQTSDDLRPANLVAFLKANAPNSEAIPLNKKTEILRAKNGSLLFLQLDPILHNMSPKNDVNDVINAVFDAMIMRNALAWVEKVGKFVDWYKQSERARPGSDLVTQRLQKPTQSDSGSKAPTQLDLESEPTA